MAVKSSAVAVKLDGETQTRLRRVADTRQRSTHWVMREAIEQYLSREEKRLAFHNDALLAWREVEEEGKFLTADEANAWLARLEAGEDIDAPQR